jgi:predicted PurR-regulated permease PerM
MRSMVWVFLAAALILVGGIVFGIAGVFLAPILGGIALIALVIWLLQRAARDKPPIK